MGRPKNPIAKYNESLSPDQHEAKKIIEKNTITCLTGYAGTGKTRIATTYALEQYALGRKSGDINKIIITRPTAFKKEHNVGFLPGDITEKYNPWIRPISEIIVDIEGYENYEKLTKEGNLEIVPLMYVQGRTFSHAVVIVDEAQNLTSEDMKSLFTRIGKSSQMIFCGDSNQCIIDKNDSGFERLVKISKFIDGLDYYELSTNWRHPIIEELLDKY